MIPAQATPKMGDSYETTQIMGNATFENGTALPVSLTTISLYTPDQKRDLRIIAISFASMSLLAGIFMTYWFIRLQRRTFRHILVMALIWSDILRSTLELAYPIVTLTRGDVAVGSIYCEVGGFFTAYFFEMSDWMIFIIAIHTAVYVFSPKVTQASDEGGLWRWRYYVFNLWFTVPALLAGLAFIHTPAYVPLVTWCYLPARPFVWRYTLAWGPRYFIFSTISVLYVTLYIYVRRTYRKIDRNQKGNSDGSEFDSQDLTQSSCQQGPHEEPPIPFPPPSYMQGKRPSIPPPVFERQEPERASSPSVSVTTETPTLDSYILNNRSAADSQLITSETHLIRPATSPFEQRNLSNATTFVANTGQPPSRRNSVILVAPPANLSFNQRRARVERQMRTLFIFPIVYFIMWIPSFINHLYQIITFDANATHLPPGTFPITVLATIFLPAQGFVNVCIYAARERPWRHNKRPSTVRRTRNLSPTTGDREKQPAPGSEQSPGALQAHVDAAKSQLSHMWNPSQAAYARREVERAERELARAQYGEGRTEPRENWWDVELGNDRNNNDV